MGAPMMNGKFLFFGKMSMPYPSTAFAYEWGYFCRCVCACVHVEHTAKVVKERYFVYSFFKTNTSILLFYLQTTTTFAILNQ